MNKRELVYRLHEMRREAWMIEDSEYRRGWVGALDRVLAEVEVMGKKEVVK